MKSEIKLSIVIPMYNVEDYIKQLLCILEKQISDDVEVILVDDGSSDETRKRIQEYSETGSAFFSLYCQDNQGASVARNTGIINSCGSYISFIDADDTIKDDYVDRIKEMLVMYPDDDMYITGFDIFNYDGEYYDTICNDTREICGVKDILNTLFHDEIKGAVSMQGKVINRRFLDKYDIFFDTECKKMNDGEFFSRCYRYIEKVLLFNYVGTNWKRHFGTLTDKHFINTPCFAQRIIDNYCYLNSNYMDNSDVGCNWIFQKKSYLIDYQLEKIFNNKFSRKHTQECVMKVMSVNMDETYILKKYSGIERWLIMASYRTNMYLFYEVNRTIKRMKHNINRVLNVLTRVIK